MGLAASIVQAGKIDLFMLAGQSNAQGWKGDAGSYPADVKGMDRTVPFFRTPRESLPEGGGTTLKPRGKIFPKGHFGLEIPLARSLKKVGYRPAIFKYSPGGTSIARNLGGSGDGKMYDRMVSQFRRARAALEEQGHEVNVRVFIWVQGESGAENIPMARAFGGRLGRLIDDLRGNVAKDRHLPTILGADGRNDRIKLPPQGVLAQQEIAEKDPFTVCTTIYGLPKADSTRLTPEGPVFHGKRILRLIRISSSGGRGIGRSFPCRQSSVLPEFHPCPGKGSVDYPKSQTSWGFVGGSFGGPFRRPCILLCISPILL